MPFVSLRSLAALSLLIGFWSGAASATAPAPVRLAALDAQEGDLFGSTVAADGATALVGAPGANDFAGAAYVFVHGTAGWSQSARLTLPDARSGDQLGSAVALAGHLALAATADSASSPAGTAGPRPAAVHAFVQSGQSWLHEAVLSLPSGEVPQAVALAGSTAVVGGTLGAYVFVRSGPGLWSLRATLRADPTEGRASGFGAAVAIDADVIAVGAPAADHYDGVVYFFARAASGNWERQARVTADAREFALFGSAVSLSGKHALIGAYGESNFQGAAYVLARTARGWIQQARLQTDDETHAYQCFGRALALAPSAAVIASPCSDPGEPVSVVVYQYAAGTAESWDVRTKIGPTPGAALENFASALATTGDITVMGSPEDSATGAVYVVECSACAP
jgi:FG-GAP repeat